MAYNYNSDTQHKFSRTLLKPSLIALAISSCFAGAALAQEQAKDAEADVKLERIEVTARRTIENLQEVPVAVTSIGAADLAERGISTVVEIQQFSPNTTLQQSRGTNSTLTAFIRGVGQEDPLWGYEPGVGIYIDDVYVARPQGAVLDILCDRLNAGAFYIGLAWLQPELSPAIFVYLAEFMVVDCFLSIAFLAWPVRSHNYFFVIDRSIWLWNW